MKKNYSCNMFLLIVVLPILLFPKDSDKEETKSNISNKENEKHKFTYKDIEKMSDKEIKTYLVMKFITCLNQLGIYMMIERMSYLKTMIKIKKIIIVMKKILILKRVIIMKTKLN